MATAATQVMARNSNTGADAVNPIDFLLTDPEDDGIFQVRIIDRGSEVRNVKVEVQGVPAYGIVDSAADITIIGGNLFKQVASVAHLRKRILNQHTRHHVHTTVNPPP